MPAWVPRSPLGAASGQGGGTQAEGQGDGELGHDQGQADLDQPRRPPGPPATPGPRPGAGRRPPAGRSATSAPPARSTPGWAPGQEHHHHEDAGEAVGGDGGERRQSRRRSGRGPQARPASTMDEAPSTRPSSSWVTATRATVAAWSPGPRASWPAACPDVAGEEALDDGQQQEADRVSTRARVRDLANQSLGPVVGPPPLVEVHRGGVVMKCSTSSATFLAAPARPRSDGLADGLQERSAALSAM